MLEEEEAPDDKYIEGNYRYIGPLKRFTSPCPIISVFPDQYSNHGTLLRPFTATIVPSSPDDSLCLPLSPSYEHCFSQCITVSPEFETKCLEELRCEDYVAAERLGIPVASLASFLSKPNANNANAREPCDRKSEPSEETKKDKESTEDKQEAEAEVELPERQSLVRILECPICFETCIPPIYSCKTGHAICNVCQPKIKVCPMCREGYSGARDYVAEKLFEALKLKDPAPAPKPALAPLALTPAPHSTPALAPLALALIPAYSPRTPALTRAYAEWVLADTAATPSIPAPASRSTPAPPQQAQTPAPLLKTSRKSSGGRFSRCRIS